MPAAAEFVSGLVSVASSSLPRYLVQPSAGLDLLAGHWLLPAAAGQPVAEAVTS